MYSTCIFDQAILPFILPHQCLPSVWLSCVCSNLITVLGMQQTLSLVQLIQFQDWLANWNTAPSHQVIGQYLGGGQRWAIIMHWYHAYGSAPKQCISHFIMSGKKVFHTTCICSERRAYQG